MRDRYHRMQAACLAMARQSTLPDEQARWLALSQECWERAAELDQQSKSDRGRVTRGWTSTFGTAFAEAHSEEAAALASQESRPAKAAISSAGRVMAV